MIIESNSDKRKQLFKLYNAINIDIYGYGVTELKIYEIDNMIIFRTQHGRVRALEVLEENHLELKAAVDKALYDEFKLRLRKALVEKMQMNISGMLRDYDPFTHVAITVALLRKE
jgi:hypothetical protein